MGQAARGCRCAHGGAAGCGGHHRAVARRHGASAEIRSGAGWPVGHVAGQQHTPNCPHTPSLGSPAHLNVLPQEVRTTVSFPVSQDTIVGVPSVSVALFFSVFLWCSVPLLLPSSSWILAPSSFPRLFVGWTLAGWPGPRRVAHPAPLQRLRQHAGHGSLLRLRQWWHRWYVPCVVVNGPPLPLAPRSSRNDIRGAGVVINQIATRNWAPTRIKARAASATASVASKMSWAHPAAKA